MSSLVYVHGRSQQGRDAEQLCRRWTDGLNVGLQLTGRDPVDPGSVCFPYFGDLLHAEELRAAAENADIDLEAVRSGSRAPLDPAMPKDVQEVESAVLRSLAEQADATGVEQEGRWEAVLRLPMARRLARAVADRTRVDQEVIRTFLRDVAVYLRVAREPVLDAVRAALPPQGDLVLVGHSLGSAVARDLLDDDQVRARTRALLTLGSPLGLEGVYRNLHTPGPAHPGVPAWMTVWDPSDFVTLGHPITGLYGGPLDEREVRNPPGHAHSIAHYLAHAEVAAWVDDHLAR